MIYIKKNTNNNVVLTLSESSTLLNPYYLFEFVYEGNLNPVILYFTTSDTSLAVDRYNLFVINENSTGSTTGGTGSIQLMGGQYRYNIYEASASTLSVSATTQRVVQNGRMFVDSNGTNTNQIIPDQNNTINNRYA